MNDTRGPSRLNRLRYWCVELGKAHLHRLAHRSELEPVTVRPGLARATHVVIMVVHNEASRIPYLLDYYRQLGFSHFLVIDNESDDGLGELVAEAPDVSLFQARGSYGEARYGNDWVNQVLGAHCTGKWILYVDADEFLIYPGSPETDIQTVTAELERTGAESLHSLLVDMYSDQPVHANDYVAGTDPLKVCPLFDRDGYELTYEPISQTTWMKGGVRGRLFFSDIWDGPALNKTPLVRWQRHFAFIKSSHQLFPPRLNGPGPQQLAQLRGNILHFKFFASFEDKLRTEEVRKQHTREYIHYRSLDSAAFVGAATSRYDGWQSAAQAGLMSSARFEPTAPLHP